MTLEPPVLVTVSDRDLIASHGYVAEAEAGGIRSQCSWRYSSSRERDVRVRIGCVRSDGDITSRASEADCGEKATVNVALWPAVSVTGVVIPLRLISGAADPDLRNRDAGAAGVGEGLGQRLIASHGYVAEAETGRIRSQCPWRDSSARQRDVRVGLEPFEVMVTLPLGACGGLRCEGDREGRALAGCQCDRSRDPTQAIPSAADSDLRNRDAGAAGVGDRLGQRLVASHGYVAEAETGRIRSQCSWRDSSS